MDNRIFTFYVNPFTDELVKLDGMATNDELRAQGVEQIASWFVADAHNWGTSTMARWSYSKVSKSAKVWGMLIEQKRQLIDSYKHHKG